jgi:hypothetical protein
MNGVHSSARYSIISNENGECIRFEKKKETGGVCVASTSLKTITFHLGFLIMAECPITS